MKRRFSSQVRADSVWRRKKLFEVAHSISKQTFICNTTPSNLFKVKTHLERRELRLREEKKTVKEKRFFFPETEEAEDIFLGIGDPVG